MSMIWSPKIIQMFNLSPKLMILGQWKLNPIRVFKRGLVRGLTGHCKHGLGSNSHKA